MNTNHRRNPESGFMLLFIFMLSAAAAIGLYLELPRVAFESQRQKEEDLVMRGMEYRRAIQLYVRKKKEYPKTIENLEKDGQLRFLRRRYVDPLTGKDEWRLIHIGPNGQFTDSLVNKPKNPNDKEGNQNTFITEGPSIGSTGPQAGGGVTVANRQRQSDMQGAPGQGVPGQENPNVQGGPPPVPPDISNAVSYQQYQQQMQQYQQQQQQQAQQAQQQGMQGQPPVGFPPNPGQNQPVGFNPVAQYVPGVGTSNAFQQRGPNVGFNPPANSQTGGMVPQPNPYGQNPYGQSNYPNAPGMNPVNQNAANQIMQMITQPRPAPGSTQQQPSFGTTNPGFGNTGGFGNNTNTGGFGNNGGFGNTGGGGGFGNNTSGFGNTSGGLGSSNPGNTTGGQRMGSSSSAFGGTSGVFGGGGGIAGIASKFEAEGIKLINERSNYKEWEFLYDYQRDPWMQQGGVNLTGQAQNPGNSVGTGSKTGSSFGNTGSSFGNSGSSMGNQGQGFSNPGSGSSFGRGR